MIDPLSRSLLPISSGVRSDIIIAIFKKKNNFKKDDC
jgi:hypothetical protein